MKNPILKYGLSGGLSLIILLLIGYSREWYRNFMDPVWTSLNIIIIIVILFLGIREIKKGKYNNEISFWRAVREGMKIVLTVTFLYTLAMYLFFISQPEIFNKYKDYSSTAAVSAMEKANYPETDIKIYTDMVEKDFSPFNLAKYNVVYMVIFGLLFSLVIAAILRTKDTPGHITGTLDNN